jgi:hypothetical protein
VRKDRIGKFWLGTEIFKHGAYATHEWICSPFAHANELLGLFGSAFLDPSYQQAPLAASGSPS